MNNFSESSTVNKVLENIFTETNKTFFNNTLKMPYINVEVLHGNQHSRFCENVHRMPDGKLVDEISIDGDIIRYDKTDVIVREIIICQIKQYASDNDIKISSRGNSYFNNKFKELAEDHGLIVSKNKTYGYVATGINDKVIELIEKNRWMLVMNRFTYVHGRKSKYNKHEFYYTCDKCGCIMRASKDNGSFVHLDCGGILKLAKVNGVNV